MASTQPNAARLKQAQEFKPRELTDATELGATPLGHLIVAIQERLKDREIDTVIKQLREMPDYFRYQRTVVPDVARFLADKAPEANVRQIADVLADRISNDQLVLHIAVTITRLSPRTHALDTSFLAEHLRGARRYRRIAGYFTNSLLSASSVR